jgi:hypothetical protein
MRPLGPQGIRCDDGLSSPPCWGRFKRAGRRCHGHRAADGAQWPPSRCSADKGKTGLGINSQTRLCLPGDFRHIDVMTPTRSRPIWNLFQMGSGGFLVLVWIDVGAGVCPLSPGAIRGVEGMLWRRFQCGLRRQKDRR